MGWWLIFWIVSLPAGLAGSPGGVALHETGPFESRPICHEVLGQIRSQPWLTPGSRLIAIDGVCIFKAKFEVVK